VSFLRPNYTFLSQALRHPSTKFLLFNNTEPLIESHTRLAQVHYEDVQPIIGEDPYSKSEEDIIKEYNSATYVPHLIFLGLDEKSKGGLKYKEHYEGVPYFALDVTPRHSITAAAESLIASLESKGLSFAKGRMHTSFSPPEGRS